MEPAFFRGDLLFLTNYPEEPIRVGEIVVFKIEGRDIPIVHRVLKSTKSQLNIIKIFLLQRKHGVLIVNSCSAELCVKAMFYNLFVIITIQIWFDMVYQTQSIIFHNL